MRRRRAPVAIVIAIALLATASPAAAASRAPGLMASPTGGWIVTLRDGQDPRALGTQLSRVHGGQLRHVYRHALSGFSFHGSAAAARAMARNPAVASVVPDRALHAVETLPFGVKRVDALHQSQPDAHEAGFTGAGVSIGILDTGIDLDHPDLDVDVARGLNCMPGGGAPEDGHGHGTHVAGTAAALRNGVGVVGIAPDAVVVPIKVLDDAGSGTDATVICGVDYLTALATDADPANDIAVANMSLGEQSSNPGHCADGGLRQAICESVAAGVTYVVAAGNSSIDAAGFVPAAYPEVITVSAMVDTDGEPGGLGGCTFLIYCDDGFAFFSDYGSIVDVAAPGVNIYSTWKNGGYQTSDGTSMAAPHVAGMAALVRAANPALTPADVENLLKVRGECPNGTTVEAAGNPGDCVGQGQWTGDPDGYPEPLPNALRAASSANGWDPFPVVTITSPLPGASVSGVVPIQATASDDVGVTHVAFEVNGAPLSDDTDGSDGWSATWDTAGLWEGRYDITAVAFDTAGQSSRSTVTVQVGVNVQGDWVGTYGADGYALLAWDGGGDLVVLPNATLTLDQGSRTSWSASTAELRALENAAQSQRRATTWYHSSSLRLHLTFSAAYSGALHLYALDWNSTARRQSVTVDDGSGPRVSTLSSPFNTGVWIHVPISVPAGGVVSVSADRTAGSNAVLSGLFLGGAGSPPSAGWEPGVQGDWVGTYGAAGYALGAWTSGTDLVSLPGATLTVEQGTRNLWSGSTTDVRALESPDQSQRRAGAWYHSSSLRLRLTFSAAFSGSLHLYAVDWNSTARRQRVSVDDGGGAQSVELSSAFNTGAWIHVPIDVAAGGVVTITADRTAGSNAVLSGVFLGD
jgi:subtilisin